MGTLKQISADFQSCWMDGKTTKYIARGKGKVFFFFTLCLKSDRIKEFLRNVLDRSFPLVEEKTLKLKKENEAFVSFTCKLCLTN